MGLLKGRFSSLRGMRLQIKNKSDIQKIVERVEAILVLHNVMVQLQDPWDELYEEDNVPVTNYDGDVNQNTSGGELRELIKRDVLSSS